MRWHHHGEFSLLNYAVFAKKKRIVYMFEAAPALAAFYFYYHSYNSFSSKTVDLIELNCAYIFVAFVVILTFFGNMYSLKNTKNLSLNRIRRKAISKLLLKSDNFICIVCNFILCSAFAV